MRLSKILQVLILIATIEKEMIVFYYFILILISSTLINIWITEINSYFFSVLNLILYYEMIDSDESTDLMYKCYTINSKNMLEALTKLKKNDLKSNLTIILNAYST
jgi:hypothetical protein